MVDRSPNGASAVDLLRRDGHDAQFVHADVTMEHEVEAAVETVVEQFGALDMVLGCAACPGSRRRCGDRGD